MDYIAYDFRNPYYLLAKDEADLPFRNYAKNWHLVNIHQPHVRLYSVRKLAGGFELINSIFDDIQRTCGYHIIFERLPSAVYRISESKLLLNSVQCLFVSRTGHGAVKDINDTTYIGSDQYIYKIPCEAKVLGQVFHSSE